MTVEAKERVHEDASHIPPASTLRERRYKRAIRDHSQPRHSFLVKTRPPSLTSQFLVLPAAFAASTGFVVETSATPAAPWTPETPAGSATTDTDNLEYPFPAGMKNFTRLNVTGPQEMVSIHGGATVSSRRTAF